MGARCAPSVAQMTTWSLVKEALQEPLVSVVTCIDNVRFASNDATAFRRAIRTFLTRCRDSNVTLNEHQFPLNEENMWLRNAATIAKDSQFLGERFLAGGVCNTPRIIEKMQRTWANISSRNETTLTRRTLVSLISLIFYACHTINIPIRELHPLLRTYSAVAAARTHWDSPAFLSPSLVPHFERVIQRITANSPAPVLTLLPPPANSRDEAYDAIIFVDACAHGFGAWIRYKQGDAIFHKAVSAGWSAPINASAHSEPLGACRALMYLFDVLGVSDNAPLAKGYAIAVVSDHVALVSGQRRSWSNYGGFSTSNYLNTFYCALYSDNAPRRDVFYIPGPSNPVDGLSRSVNLRDKLVSKDLTCVFPSLDGLEHPYCERPKRKWFEV